MFREDILLIYTPRHNIYRIPSKVHVMLERGKEMLGTFIKETIIQILMLYAL